MIEVLHRQLLNLKGNPVPAPRVRVLVFPSDGRGVIISHFIAGAQPLLSHRSLGQRSRKTFPQSRKKNCKSRYHTTHNLQPLDGLAMHVASIRGTSAANEGSRKGLGSG
ncbi:hypothetical protein TWF106_000845 [Orbilia oligospora]|uniref:Uncharacterized protein n=1 Tax=Orbilia oligospora TaxID=2813651 RepID=A0A7C8QW41_ORBOL|nr:hypothetical protein TWF788_000764 [Orbilia oligospora]KAF3226350.1 hypothetical protein TWF106_000845 [Orbilia oligospora]